MRSTETTVTIGITDTALLGHADDRVGIIFSSDATTRYTVTTQSVAVLDHGMVIQVGQVPVMLDARTFGELTKRAWRGIANAAPVTVNIIEIFL